MAEVNCLPMCSLCSRAPTVLTAALKRCSPCKTRTYCNKKCQILDWKLGGHKKWCGARLEEHAYGDTHQLWCAYLDRNPELDDQCVVETNTFRSNPREVISTGMNTCMFVTIKTKNEIVGWHASVTIPRRDSLHKKLSSITKENFVSGFIVPGEDRKEGTLDLKPTCRTMKAMPWTDPSHSRKLILNFLKQFEWYDKLEVMLPVKSYKDFVVFDMAHRRPYTFSDTEMFDQGCTFDGAVDDYPMVNFFANLSL